MKRDPKSIRAAIPGIFRILRQFAPQIRQERRLLAVSFLALMAEIILHLLEPWPLKFIFDYILLKNSSTQVPDWMVGVDSMTVLSGLTIALLAIAALRASCAYFSVAGMAQAATNILTQVRAQLYSHIQNLSLSFHHQAKTGDLITRVTSDVDRLREVTVMAILPLIAHSLTLIGMIGVMFWMHWELALIAASIIPVFLVITIRLTRRIRTEVKAHRQQEGALAATAAESIGAIKVVQALSLQGFLENIFLEHNRDGLAASIRAQRLSAGLERVVEMLVGVATAFVLWRGVQLVMGQALTPGDLLVFVNYLRIAFKPMRQLAKFTGQVAKATASGERILDILDTVPTVQDTRGAVTAPHLRGMVQFKNVSFSYENEQAVLKQVSLTVYPGQRVALVGSSGGGKSTLASLLLRLYDPLEGSILVDGRDIREFKLDSYRNQISVVLQESVLFAATVRDNIAYGSLGATQAEIEMAARLANAHTFILQLPQGYDTVLGERGATLSGGQRQRIAIARAAIRQAPIVILDEATTGLDNENEAAVYEALDALTEGCTTFIISHDLQAIARADMIFYLENGRIVEQGDHCSLLRQGGRYAALYALETAIAR